LVGIAPVVVPPDADAETMERLRLQVEAYLNEATRRAYEQVGRPEASLPAKSLPPASGLAESGLPGLSEKSLSEKSVG
jgi:hypothetical protein